MKAPFPADSNAGLLLVFGDSTASTPGSPAPPRRSSASSSVSRWPTATSFVGRRHPTRGGVVREPRELHSSPQRDLFERRLEQHRVAFVKDVAARCLVVARERGWPLVLVLGDPHLTAPAAEVLRHGGVEAQQSNRGLAWKTHHELALAVADVEQALLAHAAGAAKAR